MKMIVRFEFDSQLFYSTYSGPRNIIFENPPHIPATGDPVNFKISDFFEDKKVIRKFNSIEENNLFYAERLQAKYHKDFVEIIIVLYEEAIFKAKRPDLFAQNSLY
ncbi:hypothetical protein AAFN85_16330 [Mucilaginibacter sp. CAU 1740]|uniref:hypothetical protein n=1 Tax=Mucilaginibacter sp. CAU 1740 TaxID=3140365 RepID=UPI00325A81AC